MKTIVITKPGYIISGFNSFKNNEYEVIPVPRVANDSLLTNEDEEADSVRRADTDLESTAYDRSTIIKLLTDETMAGKYVMICSSDIHTRIHSKALKTLVDKVFEEHKDIDIFSLFNNNDTTYELTDFVSSDEEVPVTDTVPIPKTESFAFIVPVNKRFKLIEIIKAANLCISDLIYYADVMDKLKVYVPSLDLTWSSGFEEQKEGPRFSVIMSSYKRPKDLVRQILSFGQQTYQNFTMHVAVKGISELDFRKLVIPQVYRMIQIGMLDIHYFPNRNQLSNYIDCVRFSNLEVNKLCVKIDDDDIYHPQFLEHLAIFHSYLPENTGSWFTGNLWQLFLGGSYKYIAYKPHNFLYGNSIVFPSEIIEELKEIEDFPYTTNERYAPRAGFREDSIIGDKNIEHGAVNRTIFYEFAGYDSDIIVDKSNASVMRSDSYIDDEFTSANSYINTNNEYNEHIIAIKLSSGSTDIARVFNSNICALGHNMHGEILDSEPGVSISVRWAASDDNGSGAEDVYIKNSDGVFSSVLLA